MEMNLMRTLPREVSWAKSMVLDPGVAAYRGTCVSSQGTVLCLCECGAMTSDYDPAAAPSAQFRLRDWLSASANPAAASAFSFCVSSR